MTWKTLTRWISHAVTVVMFALMVSTLVLVVTSKTSGEAANLFGYQIKTVLSGSMEPEFQTGSIIAIRTGGEMDRFQTGDVITFQAEENKLITHRITEVKQGGAQYITKGDANGGADLDPVLKENIVGEYRGFTVPYIGYAVHFAGTREGAALLMILPGLLFLGYAAISIWRALNQIHRMVEKDRIDVK